MQLNAVVMGYAAYGIYHGCIAAADILSQILVDELLEVHYNELLNVGIVYVSGCKLR